MTDPGFGTRCPRCDQLVAIHPGGQMGTHARPGSGVLCSPEIVGYVIAERHTFGPNEGKLDADWDGEIHPTRESANAELALANGRDGCCNGAHWKLYELREVL